MVCCAPIPLLCDAAADDGVPVEGHVATDCTNPRKLSYLVSAEDLDQETAWDLMKAADAEEDFDEFKVHMLEYIKASPTLSLDELETAFRSAGFHYYLYALTMDITYDKCLVGIHGEKDAEYLWSLNKSARPRRSKAIAHRMAATAEENLVRLKHAGSLEDELGPLCHQCKGIYSSHSAHRRGASRLTAEQRKATSVPTARLSPSRTT